MDKGELEGNATPRTRRANSASKAAAGLKKFVTRRLAKSISSERDVQSISSSENAQPSASLSKRFSLRKRQSGKSRPTSHSERDSKPEAPRRSLSVSDMTQIGKAVDEDGAPIPLMPLEKEVKVPEFDDTEQFVQEIQPRGEGPVPPETPVPEQRHEKRTDTRSSSSVNVSLGNDEMREVESTMLTDDQQPPMEIVDVLDDVDVVTDAHMEALIAEKVNEISGLDDLPRGVPTTDGHAEIAEPEIKEALAESFAAAHEETEHVAAPEEIEEAQEVVQEQADPLTELLAAADAAKETSTPAAQIDDLELEKLDAFMSATEKKTETTTRDFDLADLANIQSAAADATHQAEKHEAADGTVDADEKPLTKPKGRRRRKIIRSASVSVAALAVGVLIMILKK